MNWKKTPVEARRWLAEHLEPVFPVGNLRDLTKSPIDRIERRKAAPVSDEKILAILGVDEGEAHTGTVRLREEQQVKIAGFGGQGVLSTGILLANCAIAEGLKTTWLPSYGAEMRGGTANASIHISHETIGSPLVSSPNALLVMNLPSLDAFEQTVRPGGAIFVNASLVPRPVQRTDVAAYHVPVTEMANTMGAVQVASVILLTVYALASGAITLETLRKVIPLSLKRRDLSDINLQAIEMGIGWWRESRTPATSPT